MSSLRIDNNEWILGSCIIGETGLGVIGSNIPSSGTNGPSFLYNDISLPADANKEIRALILTLPSDGNLFVYEDGSFTFSDAPDGEYSFTYQLYVDGVATGGVTTVTLAVGIIPWESSATSQATCTASLTTSIMLGSNALSVSTTTANLTTGIKLTAAAVSTSTTSANLSAQALLAAVAQSVSTCSASLTTNSSGTGTSANTRMILEYKGIDYSITLI